VAPDSGFPGQVPSSTPIFTKGATLHLGVLVQPYRASGKKVSAITTGDVAQILEDKYGVMAAFYRVREKDIGNAIENSLQGAMESMMMGGRAIDPWGAATQGIQRSFRYFISSSESERVGIPGTPTKAALRGVNHRLKHPYAKRNKRRPSFRDTYLYMNSFRAWVD
jgi:hypothetical protein